MSPEGHTPEVPSARKDGTLVRPCGLGPRAGASPALESGGCSCRRAFLSLQPCARWLRGRDGRDGRVG